MRPPTVGPRASANAEVPAHSPIAFARSCGGNVTVMIDSVPGGAAPRRALEASGGDQLEVVC